MDPLTQGLLGAGAAQATFGRKVPRAWLVGAVAGLIPDLDILVRSTADPLLAIEAHRQFTHALLFIPLGGLIAVLPWLLRRRHRPQWRSILGAATIAYATHGLLDAFTTYGTQLLWPFSTLRVSWNAISIIDPVFTLALLIGVVWAARHRARLPAIVALCFAAAYLGTGVLQRERALDAQARIAEARGHAPDRGAVFPTLGNQLVWRSLYRSGDTLYADRIRVPWGGTVQWSPGMTVAQMKDADLAPELRAEPRILEDFQRFRWFADGWIARAPDAPEVVGDVRYSLRTDAFAPIWGVRFHPERAVPTEWVNRTGDRNLRLSSLWAELAGTHPDYRPLDASAGAKPFP